MTVLDIIYLNDYILNRVFIENYSRINASRLVYRRLWNMFGLL